MWAFEFRSFHMFSQFIHVVASISFNHQWIFHCIHTTICLSIHPLRDSLAVTTFWRLWIVLLWTFMYKYLFDYLLSIFLGMYLGVEFLGHIITLCLSFWERAKVFSTVAVPFYVTTSNVQGFQFFYTLINTYFPLLSIFHVFVGHLHTFFGEMSSNPLPFFRIGLSVFLLLSCQSSLYIMYIKPIAVTICKCFLHSVHCLSTVPW